MGFQSTKSDVSYFTKVTQAHTLFILVYVVDIIIIGSSLSAINSLTSSLNFSFPLKHMGDLHYFLGIQVQNQPFGCISLTQTKYIQDLLLQANMENPNHMPTHMVSNLKLSLTNFLDVANHSLYRSIVGGQQYVTITPSNMAYVVNKVFQFMHPPKEAHWTITKHILRYLQGISYFGLAISKSTHLHMTTLCDVNWGPDIDDRRSTTGYCVYLINKLVS